MDQAINRSIKGFECYQAVCLLSCFESIKEVLGSAPSWLANAMRRDMESWTQFPPDGASKPCEGV